MFYDLNIPWTANDPTLPRTLAFAHELGYTIIALNHTITGKLPPLPTNPIPCPLPHTSIPPTLTILRRVTLTLTESHQNARLAALAKEYDILAVRPIDETGLKLACSSLDCDVISLDLTQRLPFFFKQKMLGDAVKAGKRIEICYGGGVLGDAQARRNLISNATQVIRGCRGGRGLVISSGTTAGAAGLRGPWDAVNLAAVWGLGQERGYEAVSKECRSVVVSAKLKRTSYRGVVDVVYGGIKPADAGRKDAKGKQAQKQDSQLKKEQHNGQGQKRKADVVDGSLEEEKPMSKRQAKKLAHQARMQAANATSETSKGPAVAESGG
jgi:ribonuclease P/MRP protein subunit RPP1